MQDESQTTVIAEFDVVRVSIWRYWSCGFNEVKPRRRDPLERHRSCILMSCFCYGEDVELFVRERTTQRPSFVAHRTSVDAAYLETADVLVSRTTPRLKALGVFMLAGGPPQP